MTRESLRSLNPAVRSLFFLRSILGRVFRLDSKPAEASARGLIEKVPTHLAEASLVPLGTPEGPFQTLYALPTEAAYQALNATVHAILSVALVRSVSGHRLFWATWPSTNRSQRSAPASRLRSSTRLRSNTPKS